MACTVDFRTLDLKLEAKHSNANAPPSSNTVITPPSSNPDNPNNPTYGRDNEIGRNCEQNWVITKKKNENVSEIGLSCGGESLTFRLENLKRYVEGEHVAAGCPAWLSTVSGEAIHGWIPLRPDAFEKLEKMNVSVLMPGEHVPTFIAHPVPVPCPPERTQWPHHQ